MFFNFKLIILSEKVSLKSRYRILVKCMLKIYSWGKKFEVLVIFVFWIFCVLFLYLKLDVEVYIIKERGYKGFEDFVVVLGFRIYNVSIGEYSIWEGIKAFIFRIFSEFR